LNRLRQHQAEAVAQAYQFWIPERFHEGIGCDVFCEDPDFAGLTLHKWRGSVHPVSGRTYREVSHCLWPHHAVDKRATVVLYDKDEDYESQLTTAIHELGHVLHGQLISRLGGWGHADFKLEPCTEYAKTNVYEAFAEAFLTYCVWSPRTQDEDPYFLGFKRSNHEFFDRLLAD
jgi:hypothetical protein